MILAELANDDGASWHSQADLAEKCEASIDTIQRDLVAMQDDGLIYVMQRFRENGGRASNEVVLLHSERARAYARSNGWEDADQAENDDLSPIPQVAVSPAKAATPLPHPCGRPYRNGAVAIEPLNEPLTTPLNLPKVDAGKKEDFRGSAGAGAPSSPTWEVFSEAWEWSETDTARTTAKKLFEKLSAQERAGAVAGAKAYHARCRQQGRRFRDFAVKWLRERAWEIYAAAPQAQKLVAVPRGSEADRAWLAYDRARGVYTAPLYLAPDPRSGRAVEACFKPSMWPPGQGPLTDSKPAKIESRASGAAYG